jgi:hypothetical protein
LKASSQVLQQEVSTWTSSTCGHIYYNSNR